MLTVQPDGHRFRQFMDEAKELNGFFGIKRSRFGKTYIGFDGVVNCAAGKAILEQRFAEVRMAYSEEIPFVEL